MVYGSQKVQKSLIMHGQEIVLNSDVYTLAIKHLMDFNELVPDSDATKKYVLNVVIDCMKQKFQLVAINQQLDIRVILVKSLFKRF